MNRTFKGISFGGFRMSECDYSLYDGSGSVVTLRRQSTLVLSTLITHHDQIVLKEQFFKEVWSRIVVTDDSLVQCISDIRRAISDSDHKIIQSIPRRGYRLNSDSAFSAVEYCHACKRMFQSAQVA